MRFCIYDNTPDAHIATTKKKNWLHKLTQGMIFYVFIRKKTDMVLYAPHNIYSALFYLISHKKKIFIQKSQTLLAIHIADSI